MTMNIFIKTPEEIEKIREGGKILAFILREVASNVKPGVSTFELDKLASRLIKENKGEAAFLNYRPEGAPYPYPASICISINDEVVHGIPTKDKVIKDGDIVSLDLGLKYKGLYTDHALTVAVGKISEKEKEMIEKTKEALDIAIWSAQGGGTVGDIGEAIQSFVGKKFNIVKELAGHGVGIKLHEDPYIPNYGKKNRGPKLVPGMIIAIEPILNNGKDGIIVLNDGWTIKTADQSKSAHFEHTILITEGEAEIITKI